MVERRYVVISAADFYVTIKKLLDCIFNFFLVSLGGVRLSPLGTSATNWPIVASPDNRWWLWSSRWNENWKGKPTYSEKTCPSANLSTTNPTWPALGSYSGRRGEKPATNRLSYDAAFISNVLPLFVRRWEIQKYWGLSFCKVAYSTYDVPFRRVDGLTSYGSWRFIKTRLLLQEKWVSENKVVCLRISLGSEGQTKHKWKPRWQEKSLPTPIKTDKLSQNFATIYNTKFPGTPSEMVIGVVTLK
jgi:hypothetical protein